MAITRPKMSRGSKLLIDHIKNPLDQISSQLTNAAVTGMQDSWGTAHINLHVPVLDSDYWTNAKTVGQKVDFCIPFCLPPLQEFWNNSGITTPDTPELILEEFSLSFDQRAEAAAIGDYWAGTGDVGNLNYEAVSQLNINIALVEKSQWFFNVLQPNEPEREVFSVELNSLAFTGKTYRFNPFIKSGLSKILNPYRTYVLMISAPDLYTGMPAASVCLPSLLLGLKIRHPMVERDKGSSIQNIPSHYGAQTGQTIAPLNPVADSIILATGTDGIQTSIEKFDRPLLEGLNGGYDKDGQVPPVEALQLDSTYEIIAVPMWGNMGIQYGVNASNPRDLPYQTTVLCKDWTMDRRIIPINYPLSIHHVTAVANYAWPFDGVGMGHQPTSATFQSAIGVAIGTGLRGDAFNYEQVAYTSWTPATITANKIDQIKARAGGTMNAQHDYDLLHVPIVGTGGNSYYPQGKPFYIAQGTTGTAPRTLVDDPGVSPHTQGCEQWIQVQWGFRDTLGLGFTPVPDAGPWPIGTDAFAASGTLTGSAGTTPVTTTVGYTVEAGEPNHGGVVGGASAWWQYTPTASGIMTVTTAGSTNVMGGPPHITMGIYTGIAVNALTPVPGTGNLNPGIGNVATWTFEVTAATPYYIATDAPGGLAQFAIINWTLNSGVAASDHTTYIGRGGNWVLLHGKKSLAST